MNSSQADNSQTKETKHSEEFVAGWMTQYSYLVPVHNEDVPEKFHGLTDNIHMHFFINQLIKQQNGRQSWPVK